MLQTPQEGRLGKWSKTMYRVRKVLPGILRFSGHLFGALALSASALGPVHGAESQTKKPQKKFTRPDFLGKSYPEKMYGPFRLVGYGRPEDKVAGNDVFFAKVGEALDLIEDRSPFIYSMMRDMNQSGERVVYYTGRVGPASFNAWNGMYVVRITATHLDPRPAFDNNKYYLAATIVHELVGHGRQASDERLWPMYRWCDRDIASVPGIIQAENRLGKSSGYVEYEANLYAKWFLYTVRGEYPDFNDRVIKRILRIDKLLEQRFPAWFDDSKPAWTLLAEFTDHFDAVCRGQRFTPHPPPPG